MTRKQRRTTVIVSGVTVLVAATLLILSALRDSIVYFHSPSEVVEASSKWMRRFVLADWFQLTA